MAETAKDERKTIRLPAADVAFLIEYAASLSDRESRGGGQGVSEAVRHAVQALRDLVEGRTPEEVQAVAAYQSVKRTGEETLEDWMSLAAIVSDHPETAPALRASVEMLLAAARAGTGAKRRARSETRKDRRVSSGKG